MKSLLSGTALLPVTTGLAAAFSANRRLNFSRPMHFMIPNQRQRLDASSRSFAAQEGASSAQLPEQSVGKPADFTDREIEMYMLPHPANPSASLQELYAAIRHQMVMDGCP